MTAVAPSGLVHRLGRRLQTSAIAIVVSSLVLSGCSAATTLPHAGSASLPAPAAPSPAGAPPTETPWQHELNDLQPDGSRSLASALRLFAMAFGPIPGVDVPKAAAGTVDSATPALRVIRSQLAALPDDQRQAVEQALSLPANSDTISLPAGPPVGLSDVQLASVHVSRGSTALPAVVTSGYPYTDFRAEITEEARRAHDKAAEYFGQLPMLRIRFHDSPEWAVITFFNPTPDGCDVFVNTATANIDRFSTRRALTLDIVHCFQGWYLGRDVVMDGAVPAWAWDGPAEYIVLELWPPFDMDTAAWARYLSAPDLPLFLRSYDAVGFFAQAQSKGLDHASAFRSVLSEGDDAARFAAVGAASSSFLDAWASALAQTYWSGDWGFDGPGIPPASEAPAPRQSLGIANDVVEAISEQPYSNHLYALHSGADVLAFQVEGHARLGDGTVDSAELGQAYFCTTDRGCGPCPDGSDPSIHPTRLAPESVLAVSGGTAGTAGTVSGHALEDFCHAPTPSPSSTAVQVKDIRSIGGHEVTFVNMVSCDGPWGHWDGEFFGISAYTRPMHFFVGGGPGDVTVTTTPGKAETPKGVISVSGDVRVTIRDGGTSMVLSGVADVVFLGPNGPLPPDHNPFSVSYPIQPADAGRCP